VALTSITTTQGFVDVLVRDGSELMSEDAMRVVECVAVHVPRSCGGAAAECLAHVLWDLAQDSPSTCSRADVALEELQLRCRRVADAAADAPSEAVAAQASAPSVRTATPLLPRLIMALGNVISAQTAPAMRMIFLQRIASCVLTSSSVPQVRGHVRVLVLRYGCVHSLWLTCTAAPMQALFLLSTIAPDDDARARVQSRAEEPSLAVAVQSLQWLQSQCCFLALLIRDIVEYKRRVAARLAQDPEAGMCVCCLGRALVVRDMSVALPSSAHAHCGAVCVQLEVPTEMSQMRCSAAATGTSRRSHSACASFATSCCARLVS
jgi:hypothetical protein